MEVSLGQVLYENVENDAILGTKQCFLFETILLMKKKKRLKFGPIFADGAILKRVSIFNTMEFILWCCRVAIQ